MLLYAIFLMSDPNLRCAPKIFILNGRIRLKTHIFSIVLDIQVVIFQECGEAILIHRTNGSIAVVAVLLQFSTCWKVFGARADSPPIVSVVIPIIGRCRFGNCRNQLIR